MIPTAARIRRQPTSWSLPPSMEPPPWIHMTAGSGPVAREGRERSSTSSGTGSYWTSPTTSIPPGALRSRTIAARVPSAASSRRNTATDGRGDSTSDARSAVRVPAAFAARAARRSAVVGDVMPTPRVRAGYLRPGRQRGWAHDARLTRARGPGERRVRVPRTPLCLPFGERAGARATTRWHSLPTGSRLSAHHHCYMRI